MEGQFLLQNNKYLKALRFLEIVGELQVTSLMYN